MMARNKKQFLYSLFLLQFLFLCLPKSNAQCTGSNISSFPYLENFENSAAWTSGGLTNSAGNIINDWTWGAPHKTVINRAGSGNKCWVTGGLTGTFYNYGCRSFIKSPCFDFTNIPFPLIEFKIWWESENKFDGTNLQYSIDNGNTWINLGSATELSNCMNQNWYNSNAISNLAALNHSIPPGSVSVSMPSLVTGGPVASAKHGWAGNIQASYPDTTGSSANTCQGGNGSNGWIIAKHCLTGLGGKPSVQLRFTFGAGTSCNYFNGIAIDSVAIGNAPANTADFSFHCVNSNTLAFQETTAYCPDSLIWNFGDPASGANNIIASPSATTPSHTFSSAGTYSVTFTAKGGPCNADASISKTVHIMSANLQAQNIACSGLNQGKIVAVMTGNAAPYQFAWNTSPAQSTDTAIHLSVGSYTVTVTSANACSVTASASISQNAPLTHTYSTVPATCGFANGFIKITESGGKAPFTYHWNAISGNTDSLQNVLAGNYSVVVLDSNGCADSVQINLSNQGGVTVSLLSVKNPTCAGDSNGVIKILPTGDTLNYSYHWGNLISTNSLQSGFKAGNYTISVFDNQGCSATVNASLTEPTPFANQIFSTPTPCNQSLGSAKVIVSGGTAPYQYVWTGLASTVDSVSNLPSNSYSLLVTDAHNCAETVAVSIQNVSNLSAQITAKTAVKCFGGQDGSTTVLATGGTPPYQYLWGSIITANPSYSSFSAGIYPLQITDNVGCNFILSDTISSPAPLALSHLLKDTKCANSKDGSAVETVSGGTFPYTYFWNIDSLTNSVSNLSAGNYRVTITDNNGCKMVDSLQINSPSSIAVNSTVAGLSCQNSNNGSIEVTATGGTPNYAYSWAFSADSTRAFLTHLPAGHYSFTVTDSHGCKDTGVAVISNPTAISSNPILTNPTCYPLENGQINLTPTGGNPLYTYLWSNQQQTNSLSNLKAGTYTVTISDSHGCKQIDTFELSNKQAISVNAGLDETIEMGTVVHLKATTPNTGAFQFLWTPTVNVSCKSCAATEATPTYTTLYTVQLRDTNGCVAYDSVLITVKNNYRLYIPNAFSPNQDGVNDVFEVIAKNVQYFELEIFNRWGEKVFYTNDIEKGWDGTFKNSLQEPGVYVYAATIVYLDNFTLTDKGSITLVR